MKHHLSLDYTIAEGWLRPWVDGLRDGRAVASTCSHCDNTQFPPLRICPNCRMPSDGWRELPGGATLLHRTFGSDGDFALARFDGAERSAVVRAEHLPGDARRGQLAAVPVGHPRLILQSESPE